MRPIVAFCLVLILSGCGHLTRHEARNDRNAEREAMRVMDDFMREFNNRDPEAWANTLNFPHHRLANGQFTVSNTAEEYVQRFSFADFVERFGWHHSKWDYRHILQSTDDKVHIAVQFSRFNAEGKSIWTYQSLYLVTLQDGHWGVKFRSSFAP